MYGLTFASFVVLLELVGFACSVQLPRDVGSFFGTRPYFRIVGAKLDPNYFFPSLAWRWCFEQFLSTHNMRIVILSTHNMRIKRSKYLLQYI